MCTTHHAVLDSALPAVLVATSLWRWAFTSTVKDGAERREDA
jgi:hypothetical protein